MRAAGCACLAWPPHRKKGAIGSCRAKDETSPKEWGMRNSEFAFGLHLRSKTRRCKTPYGYGVLKRSVPETLAFAFSLRLHSKTRRSKTCGWPQMEAPPFKERISIVLAISIGNGPNTVSESTVSYTDLSEFFGPHEFRGENSVSSSEPIIFVCQSELTEFFAELTEFWRRN